MARNDKSKNTPELKNLEEPKVAKAPLENLEVTVTPNASVKSGKELSIQVTTDVSGKEITAVSSVDDVIISKQEDGTTFKVNSDISVDAVITLSCEGYNNKEVEVSFTAKDVLSLVCEDNIVDIGTPITITVTGTEETLTVKSLDEAVATVEYSDGTATVTTLKGGESTIVFSAPGVVTAEYKVHVTESDELGFELSMPDKKAQVNNPFCIRAWYDKKAVTCTCASEDVVITPFNAYPLSRVDNGIVEEYLVTEFYVNIAKEGQFTLVLKSSDQSKTKNVVIDAFDLGVNSYMELEAKTITLRLEEEKYILAEVANEDSDVTITSKGTETQSIELRKEANRIYVKGKKPGKYTIEVTHPRYRTSKFFVQVLNENMPEPVVEGPKEYYDLGAAPEVTIPGINSDNFVEKVIGSEEITTDKQRLAYILSRTVEFPAYGDVCNRLCKANELLLNKEDNQVLKSKGSDYVINVINAVLSNPDYITFKQQMLLIKLVFKTYTTGLAEDNIKTYIKDLDQYEATSDVLTYIEKDIANQLNSINVKNMSNNIPYRAKERLLRYQFEAQGQ